MDPTRWEKVGEIFGAASELEPMDREAYIREACRGDESLADEVRSLLEAGDNAGKFISSPIVERFAPDLVGHLDVLSPGSLVGHYRIERAIGAGGMGEVFLATDTKLGRGVALKTLPPSFATDPSFLKRFRNEAFAAANLNHPNAATVYSVEEFEGIPFITMEYIEGRTLDQVTPEGGLDVKTFLAWLEPIADALAHAHKRGVIHRDIKPSNIMVSPDGTPKILDFGLACFERSLAGNAVSRSDITAPGQIIGTPSYMSPEHAEGGSIDARSDIFSFGTVMYEALTGKRPFRGPSQGLIVRAVIHDQFEPITSLRPDAPPALVKLIERCLQKSPQRRFQKMRELHGILKELRVAQDAGISADSFVRRFYREARSPSKLWWAATAALVVILAIGSWYVFSRATPPPFQTESLTLRKLSQSNDVIYAHVAPDGNSMAYVTAEPDNLRGMYVRNIADRNALQLIPPSPLQFWGGFAISQDSSSIYYVTAERAARHGTLYRISSRGGAPRKLVDTVNDLGSLSPDGERLLFVRYGSVTDLVSCRAADGTDEQVIASAPEGSLFRDPQYSADGRSVFVIRFERLAGVESWSLVEIMLADRTERVIIPKQSPRINEIAPLKDGEHLLVNSTDPLTNLAQIYSVSVETGAATRVTNDLNYYFGISVDAAGEKVITAQRFDSMRVWVGDVAALSDMKPITPEPNAWLETAWTPDGRIVYDAVDNNRPHIFVIDRDGTGLQQLTPDGSSDFHPRVTPDGRYIVFTSDRTGSNRVWRMNADGSDPVQISPHDGVGEGGEISGDGRSVYFSYSNLETIGVAKISIDGGPMELQSPRSENYWVPSPDGRQVAYTVTGPPAENPKLGVAKIGEAEPSRLIDVWPIYVLRWSSDSRKLYFRERESGSDPYSSLWEYDLASGSSRLVIDASPDVLRDASFSMDGRSVAVIRGTLLTDAVLISNSAAATVPRSE